MGGFPVAPHPPFGQKALFVESVDRAGITGE